MIKFLFWEPVLVHNHVTSYPSTADKILVRFVGFADTVGNAGCYKVYNPETGQVLYRDSQGVQVACRGVVYRG